jgi:hypothetical protein
VIAVLFIMTQSVLMLRQKTAFTNIQDVRRLLKAMIVSTLLLSIATLVVFLESALFQWQDYKTVYFSICLTWNTANTLCIIGYLIHVREKSQQTANSTPSITRVFRSWSEQMLVPNGGKPMTASMTF